jgi:ribose transport system substrate-binding protein
VKKLGVVLAAVTAVAAVVISTSTGAAPTAKVIADAACGGSRPVASESKILATGPNGEKGVHASTVKLTKAEIAKLKGLGRTLKVATFWQVQVDNTMIMLDGIKKTFAKYGLPITISGQAMANWDAARQADQIQTLIQTKPDALIGILVDPSAAGTVIRTANKAKIPVVFWDVPATGAQFSAIVTSHGRIAGWKAADQMAEAIGCEGEIAVLPMKFKFYPTDQRVNGFLERIKTYPKIKVVADDGATVFDDGEQVGSAILQRNPNLKGVFASWQDPAMGVISAARTLGRTSLAVTTVDLAEKPGLELATCGILKGTVAQLPYDEGVAEATAVAKILAGSTVPKFMVTDVPAVTHANVVTIYPRVFHKAAPKKLAAAYRKSC